MGKFVVDLKEHSCTFYVRE